MYRLLLITILFSNFAYSLDREKEYIRPLTPKEKMAALRIKFKLARLPKKESPERKGRLKDAFPNKPYRKGPKGSERKYR